MRALIFTATLLLPVVAHAAPCNAPDLIDTTPADGATAVPTDAALTAHYAITADYLGEEVILEKDGVGRSLGGAFDATQGLLTIRPPEPLVPGVLYKIKWPGLRGVNSSGIGSSKDVTFTVGDGPDRGAPRFEGLTGVSWDVRREHSDCTDSIEERYRFTVAAGESEDDAGRPSLSLVVFLTAGPGVDSPRPVLTRAMPAAGGSVTLELPIGDGLGHVCFAAVARDLTDRTSGGGDREVCTETIKPPFFVGCAMGRGPVRGGPLFLLVPWLLVLRRRR